MAITSCQVAKEMRSVKMSSLLSVEKAAEFLSISPWTVRAYLRNGQLKPTRIGRRVLLRQEELERFVQERTIGAGN
jgi:excisionase family DNA binding protein